MNSNIAAALAIGAATVWVGVSVLSSPAPPTSTHDSASAPPNPDSTPDAAIPATWAGSGPFATDHFIPPPAPPPPPAKPEPPPPPPTSRLTFHGLFTGADGKPRAFIRIGESEAVTRQVGDEAVGPWTITRIDADAMEIGFQDRTLTLPFNTAADVETNPKP